MQTSVGWTIDIDFEYFNLRWELAPISKLLRKTSTAALSYDFLKKLKSNLISFLRVQLNIFNHLLHFFM